MALSRLYGKWLEKNLLLVVKATNGEKQVIIYGRMSEKFKKVVYSHGFKWDNNNHRWVATIPKTSKTPLT